MTAAPDRRPRVLLVDDEPLVGRIVTRVLDRHAEVRVVGDADEALAIVHEDHGFDLVLCDLALQRGCGPSFYRSLAAVDPALAQRVVVLTGGATTPEAQEFVRSMGDRVLLKPFTAEQLRGLVRRFAPAGDAHPG